MSKEEVLLNQEIHFKEVRCVGDDGEVYGIISSSEAQKIANSKGLDLVLISPNANPPVCKVMDYGKYRYQLEKKQKEARKKQKQIEIKEIKLSTQIAQNDINYKVKHAREFIAEQKHVKFKVVLKGRETSDPQGGFEVLRRIAGMIEDVATSEKEPRVEGRYVIWLFVPKKQEKNHLMKGEQTCQK
ncbi:translation initiation factor IF-3 [Helicobacter mustelae]|uniref:translation initiation factor IF-3 n=1 Tax=Helicobacter mustelae TaxID=217 RepID=UPI000E013F87|nr:translation initiation factor IF-3 [Helicobacter mustelae]STP12680.1 translation initiation factor IF-3 [Helicobacter mustelae]